eukprot:7571696-Karenia_brevis.AAC.1
MPSRVILWSWATMVKKFKKEKNLHHRKSSTTSGLRWPGKSGRTLSPSQSPPPRIILTHTLTSIGKSWGSIPQRV